MYTVELVAIILGSDGEVKRSEPVKRFITRSFIKRFMLWPSSGLKNEQRLRKCCDSLQLLVSHLVLLLIPCFKECRVDVNLFVCLTFKYFIITVTCDQECSQKGDSGCASEKLGVPHLLSD